MKNKYFYITLGLSFVLGSLPCILFLIFRGYYPHIPLEVADDTLYYFTRIHEVLRGHLFIGNSYIYEHINDVTTAFFVADWVYSIPFIVTSFLGLSFSIGIIASNIIWSVITGYLLYKLYELLNVPNKVRPYAVFVSLFSVLVLIIRPVTMSVVYPSFLLFLISLLAWLRNKEGKMEQIYLVLSSVWCFYVYTYLWQIALVTLSLLLLESLFNKEHRMIIIHMLLSVCLLSIPVFIYTWHQLHAPFYFETLKRVGLMNTHMIGASAILYMCLIFICLGSILILKRQNKIEKKEMIFFGVTFLALLGTLMSNIITGKDLEIAAHVGRFIDMSLSIFFIYLGSIIWRNKTYKNILLIPLFLLIVFLGSLFINTIRVFAHLSNTRGDKEYFEAPLKELNRLPFGIVLSNDYFGSYVPIFTSDYVVFHPNAELYLAGNKEIEDRYLVSRILMNIDEDIIKADLRKYTGVGNAIHEANVHNRAAKVCVFIKKVYTKSSCNDSFVNSIDLRGEEYFKSLFSRYSYMRMHVNESLKKFNVNYIVLEKGLDIFENIPGNIIWQNESFIIYKVE